MSLPDDHWMRHALTLAELGRGAVEPNPLVGSVVLDASRHLVGAGWHERFGGPHAEIAALDEAGDLARGGTLLVTLEPCCHHGKTPPCTDRILQAGIRRVVAAMADPFPEVAGQGLAALRAAGIEVDVGLMELEARRLNAPYLTLLSRGRPQVHAKWAMSLDGRIATRTGESRWISNEASRRRVHALRGRMDAILVGMGTVLADDPLLTARPPGPRTPVRVVLDSKGRLPAASKLARTLDQGPVLAAVCPGQGAALVKLGIEVLELPERGGRPSIPSLLDELGRRRMTNVLVEGGAEVLGAFLDEGAIDEVHVFIAPLLIGGKAAFAPLAGAGIERLASACRLDGWRIDEIEGDLLVHGWRNPPEAR